MNVVDTAYFPLSLVPEVPLKTIFSNFDIRDIVTVSNVCRYFYTISTQNTLWKRIADQIGCPINEPIMPGDVRKRVIQFIYVCKMNVCNLPGERINSNIVKILVNSVPLTIENVQCLIDFRKARDKITVWKKSAVFDCNPKEKEIYEEMAKVLSTASLKSVITYANLVTNYCIDFIKKFPTSGEELNISCNNLITLPEEICNITQLRILQVAENKLTTLPSEIRDLTNLTRLDVSMNKLSHLPKEISQLTQLKYFTVNDNQLIGVPTEIGKMTNLSILFFVGNQLNSLPKEIGLLTNLTALGLDGNQFTKLTSEVGKLISLEALQVNHNGLTEVPSELSSLTSLKFLYLNNNKLTEVPSELSSLTNLKYLDISNNQIQTLPKEINTMRRNKKLKCNVDGNPLVEDGNPMVTELRSSKRHKKS